MLSWFPQRIYDAVDRAFEERAHKAGRAMVNISRSLVPVDTGLLKSRIYYTYLPAERLLTLHADTHYAYFVEAGTFRMRPQPYLRPALQAAAPYFGVKTQIMTGTSLPVNYTPSAIMRHIRPQIAAANRKWNRGAVARASLTWVHMNRQNQPLLHTAPGGQRFVVKSSMSRLNRLRRPWN